MLPVTRYLHSRYNAAFALLLMLVGAWLGFSRGEVLDVPGDKGFALPSAIEWISSPLAAFWVNIACNVLAVGLMIWINRSYNFIRALTLIYVSFFAYMQLATPVLLDRFYSGTVLTVVLLFCTGLLFDCFGRPRPESMRKVFMIFFLLSAGTATQYVYAGYMLVFLTGCIQMRIFTLRTVLAALLGVVTPWIMMIGSGLVQPSQLHWPTFVSIFADNNITDTMALLLTALLTVLLLFTGMTLTFFKVLTYNARRRSFNGMITVLSVFTVLAMMVDYTNLVTYIPTLNVCAAFSVSHFFAIHETEKSYIAIVSLYVIYIALFVWKIVV